MNTVTAGYIVISFILTHVLVVSYVGLGRWTKKTIACAIPVHGNRLSIFLSKRHADRPLQQASSYG